MWTPIPRGFGQNLPHKAYSVSCAGALVHTAKAVCDAAHGGTVLLSDSTVQGLGAMPKNVLVRECVQTLIRDMIMMWSPCLNCCLLHYASVDNLTSFQPFPPSLQTGSCARRHVGMLRRNLQCECVICVRCAVPLTSFITVLAAHQISALGFGLKYPTGMLVSGHCRDFTKCCFLFLELCTSCSSLAVLVTARSRIEHLFFLACGMTC